MKPNRPTTIISLNTHLIARTAIALPDRATKDHVTRLLRQGSDDMPMVAGYLVTLSLARGCAQLLISKHGKHLLTAGLAWADGTGLELCIWAKARPDLAQVPVLLCSGRDDPETRRLALEAGAVDFVAKPFIIAELRKRIRLHLQAAG